VRYKFKHEPYAHQLEALKHSCNKSYYAYFMDMGTGKSKVLIDNVCILYDQGKIDSALIVAPKSVYRNWELKEIPTHLPTHVEAVVVSWSPHKTQKKLKELGTLDKIDHKLKIFLMNIEALSTKRGYEKATEFLSCRNALLAIDESTTIKSPKAARTKNLTKLRKLAPYRRILTGSPVTKSPIDLYSQCEFLEEECLNQSSFWSFQNRYAKMVRRTISTHSFHSIVGYQNLTELNTLLTQFSYRVRKEDCLDLPDKIYIKREVELTEEQKKIYEDLKNNAMAFIESKELVTAPTILTQLLRLQQLCSGFTKTEEGIIVPVKSRKIEELMATLEETQGKVIIWGFFTQNLLEIHQAIATAKTPEGDLKYGPESVELFYGETKSEERQNIVERFQDPNSPLRFFVGQPRTGGYGLTLTEAKTVIYYSNGYDLEVRLQSEDRAHRIGQTNKVTYVDIVAKDTIDEKILQALRSKIDISARVMKEGYKEWIV
tara:strand:- start:994 stop:2457 length:1464 start_codon:yes stop_codon:yes gene_type:complete